MESCPISPDPIVTSAMRGALHLKRPLVLAPPTRMQARQPGEVPYGLDAVGSGGARRPDWLPSPVRDSVIPVRPAAAA